MAFVRVERMWSPIHALPQPVPAVDCCCSIGHRTIRFVGVRQPWPTGGDCAVDCQSDPCDVVHLDDSGRAERQRLLGRVQGALAIKCSGRNGGGRQPVLVRRDAARRCIRKRCNRLQARILQPVAESTALHGVADIRSAAIYPNQLLLMCCHPQISVNHVDTQHPVSVPLFDCSVRIAPVDRTVSI